jgi:hypothetical protein
MVRQCRLSSLRELGTDELIHLSDQLTKGNELLLKGLH